MQVARLPQLGKAIVGSPKANAGVSLGARVAPQAGLPAREVRRRPAVLRPQFAVWLLSASRLSFFLSFLSYRVYSPITSRNEARSSVRPMWSRLTLPAGLGPGNSTFRIARIPKTSVWSSAKNPFSRLRRSAFLPVEDKEC